MSGAILYSILPVLYGTDIMYVRTSCPLRMNSKIKGIVGDTGRCKSKRMWFFGIYDGCFWQTYQAFLYGAYNAWHIPQSRSVEPFNESRLYIIQVMQEICPALGVYCSYWNDWKFYVSVLFQPQIFLDSFNIHICFLLS